VLFGGRNPTWVRCDSIPWRGLKFAIYNRVKTSALVISFILASLASLAQNPEVDSLRLHAKSTPKVKLFQVELCEAFARYGMLDSAQIYLQRSRDRKTESNEIKIRWELIDAQVATSQFDFTSAQAHLDSALRIVRKCEPSFRIQKRVYTEVLMPPPTSLTASTDYPSQMSSCEKRKWKSLIP